MQNIGIVSSVSIISRSLIVFSLQNISFLDEDEDYDFIADLKRQQLMNMETRNNIEKMRYTQLYDLDIVADQQFSEKSVLHMTEEQIKRSICCIEQQLLMEDDSPLSHVPQENSKKRKQSKYSLEVIIFQILFNHREKFVC